MKDKIERGMTFIVIVEVQTTRTIITVIQK